MLCGMESRLRSVLGWASVAGGKCTGRALMKQDAYVVVGWARKVGRVQGLTVQARGIKIGCDSDSTLGNCSARRVHLIALGVS